MAGKYYYYIYIQGIHPRATRQQATEHLAHVFGIRPERARRFLEGLPRYLSPQPLERTKAERLLLRLERSGFEASLRSENTLEPVETHWEHVAWSSWSVGDYENPAAFVTLNSSAGRQAAKASAPAASPPPEARRVQGAAPPQVKHPTIDVAPLVEWFEPDEAAETPLPPLEAEKDTREATAEDPDSMKLSLIDLEALKPPRPTLFETLSDGKPESMPQLLWGLLIFVAGLTAVGLVLTLLIQGVLSFARLIA